MLSWVRHLFGRLSWNWNSVYYMSFELSLFGQVKERQVKFWTLVSIIWAQSVWDSLDEYSRLWNVDHHVQDIAMATQLEVQPSIELLFFKVAFIFPLYRRSPSFGQRGLPLINFPPLWIGSDHNFILIEPLYAELGPLLRTMRLIKLLIKIWGQLNPLLE